MDNRDVFNRKFLHEVEGWRGRNALLILIDGSLVFGSIGSYDDGFVSVLPPFNVVGTSSAVYRPPTSPALQDVTAQEVWVRGDDIAAAFTGAFAALPFVLSSAPMAVVAFNARVFVQYEVHEHFIQELVERLDELKGQNVVLRSLGGWRISGQLGEEEDCVVWLGPSSITLLPFLTDGAIGIFGAVVPGGASLTDKFRGLVNVVALVGIG